MFCPNYLFRVRLAAFMFAAGLLATSCAGSLFKVKPVVELPPLTGDVKAQTPAGVTVRVAPLKR